MPGDKWPDYNPNIGWSGQLAFLALMLLALVGSLGWLLV